MTKTLPLLLVLTSLLNCGGKETTDYPPQMAPSSTTGVDKIPLSPMPTRLLLLDGSLKTRGVPIYYDTKYNCTCAEWPAEAGNKRCLPLAELEKVACLEHSTDPAMIPMNFSSLTSLYSSFSFYKGENCGQTWFGRPLGDFYTFSDSAFIPTRPRDSNNYCFLSPVTLSWVLSKQVKLSITDFQLLP